MCDEKGIGTLITELNDCEALILVNDKGKWLGGAVNTEISSLSLAGHYLQMVGIKIKNKDGKITDITDLLVQDDAFRILDYCYSHNTSIFCGELHCKKKLS